MWGDMSLSPSLIRTPTLPLQWESPSNSDFEERSEGLLYSGVRAEVEFGAFWTYVQQCHRRSQDFLSTDVQTDNP